MGRFSATRTFSVNCEIDRLTRAAAWLVPDSHTFFDARFSCRELKRFMSIARDWTMAAKLVEAQRIKRTFSDSCRQCSFDASVDVTDASTSRRPKLASASNSRRLAQRHTSENPGGAFLSGKDFLAVGRGLCRPGDSSLSMLDGRLSRPGGRVPHFDRTVLASAGNPLAIGAECHAPHNAHVPFEGEEFLAARCVPQFDRFVAASAGNPLPLRAECHAHYRPGVPSEREHFLAARRVPNFYLGAFIPNSADSTGNPLAVGTECHAPRESLVPKGEEVLAARCAPHFVRFDKSAGNRSE